MNAALRVDIFVVIGVLVVKISNSVVRNVVFSSSVSPVVKVNTVLVSGCLVSVVSVTAVVSGLVCWLPRPRSRPPTRRHPPGVVMGVV